MNLKSVARACAEWVEELVRLGILFALERIARQRSRRFALVAADACGWILLLLPTPGLSAWLTMRSAFGTSTLASAALARRWIAQPLRDFVILRRVLSGRENPRDWRIVQRNSQGVERLLSQKKSFIVVSAHFAREAMYALFSPVATGHRVVQVAAPTPNASGLRAKRILMQYGTLMDALVSGFWNNSVDVVFVGPEHMTPSVKIFKEITNPPVVISVALDAPWSWKHAKSSTYVRPFAALPAREFSMGILEIARLTGCPVVPCVPRLGPNSDGAVELEWGEPISNIEDPHAVMDNLLGLFETAIGEVPWQYLLEMGRGRRWNPSLRRWEAEGA